MAANLRQKYQEEQEEIKLLATEHQREKEDINDLFRIQEKELKMLKQIAKQIFKKDELE